MNGIYILLTILLYFGILLLVARLTGRHSDNDAFFRGNRRSPWYIVSFGMIGASFRELPSFPFRVWYAAST